MPVPSTINDLSTTAASNSPAGSDSVFPDLDNYLRAHASFIAQTNESVVELQTDVSNLSAAVVSVRDFGAVLDGTTDDLAAFNSAIQSVASGKAIEIIVDAPAYLSAATTNSGRYPTFILRPGAYVTATSGVAANNESSRFSWPSRHVKQLTNGPRFEYAVVPVQSSSTYGHVRGTYKQITGNQATINSGGSHDNSVGERLDYYSWSYGSGSDIMDYKIGIWGRSAAQDGGGGFGQNIVAVGCDVGGAAARSSVVTTELNAVNRYADTGWTADRSTLYNWSGMLQVVPEADDFGTGSTTYNVTFGIMIGHSASNKADGIPAQQWTGILGEANGICGDGYGIYWSGNDTGTSARDPKAVMATAQTWKTGINHYAATYTTGRAMAMATGHRISWIDGSSNELAGIRTGTGTPEGVVTAPVGSMFLRQDGGAGTTLYVKESGTGNTGWVGK